MKLGFNMCVFMCILCLPVFSQIEGRVTYRMKSSQVDFMKDDKSPNAVYLRDFVKNLNHIRDSINLYLDIKNHESIFYVDKKTNLGLSSKNGYRAVIKSISSFYRNNKSKLLIESINSDRLYLVHSKPSNILWEITNQKKKIDGYTCIKATTKTLDKTPTKGTFEKTVIAWFNPEIPIQYGPNNYGDLPGLIMELKDGKKTYYVTRIDFDKKNHSINIAKPSKGKLISRTAYFNLMPKITRDNAKDYIGN